MVAVGDCGAGCGAFSGAPGIVNGTGAVAEVLPVHLHIRGCPPSPLQLLQGLLALMDG